MHLKLFASTPDEKQFCLIGESFGKVVLDLGCLKTLSGETCMNEYLRTLLKGKLPLLNSKQNNSTCRFSNGKEAKAFQTIKTSAVIRNKFLLQKLI